MGFTVNPFDPVADAKERAAKIRSLNSELMMAFTKLDESYRTFWGSKNPQDVANELGVDGPAMSTIHEELNAIRVRILLHDGKPAAGPMGPAGVTLKPPVDAQHPTDPTKPESYVSGPPAGQTIDQAATAAQGKLVVVKS